MGLFKDIDPIFFYHKSVKPLLAMGFNGVVTPSDQEYFSHEYLGNSSGFPFGFEFEEQL